MSLEFGLFGDNSKQEEIIWILLYLFWAALLSSQSAMDLVDFFIVVTAFVTAFKSGEVKKLLIGFQPAWIWPLWLSIVFLGYVFGFEADFLDKAKGFVEFKWILSFLSLIYLFSKVTWNEKSIKNINYIFIFFCLIDFVVFFSVGGLRNRAGGLFFHAMPFAHTMGPATALLLFVNIQTFLTPNQPRIAKVWAIVSLGLSSALVLLTFTRGIWIGVIFSSLVAAAFLGRRVLITFFLVLTIGSALVFVSSKRVQTRVLGKTFREVDSNSERKNFWIANLNMFKESPIVGVGYNVNNIHLPEYLSKIGFKWEKNSHAHNQYIQYLAGTGVLGLLTFLFFIGSILKAGFFYLKKEMNGPQTSQFGLLILGCYMGLGVFLIGSLTESNFSIAKNRFLFLFLAAILFSAIHKKSQSTK